MNEAVQLAALRRGVAVLRALAARRSAGCTFTQLRGVEEHLTSASLSRLLKVMQAECLVRKAEGNGLYFLADEFVQFARDVAGVLPPAERLAPVLRALAAETGESIAFFEPQGESAVIAAKVEMPDRFHYRGLGEAIGPLAGHGAGAVLLAWGPPELTAAVLAAERLPLPAAQYRAWLKRLRGGQLVLGRDLMDPGRGAWRIAAPVFSGPGAVLAGALVLSTHLPPADAAAEARLADLVRAAAARASTLLGALPLSAAHPANAELVR